MAKKVLVVSTSLRGNSNSEILAKECERGAKDAGHGVEFVSLRGKDIRFCIGCMTCQKTGRCVLKDDVAEIMAKVKESEVAYLLLRDVRPDEDAARPPESSVRVRLQVP